MKSNTLFAIGVLCGAAPMSQAAFFNLSGPTVTPNQPGTFFVTGSVTVGAGESVLSPNLVSTVWLPFLPAFTAGFNSNCGNFDNDFLSWNGTSNYTGKILDFTVDPGSTGYSSGMPLGLYNFNPFGPSAQPGVSLDWLDPNGLEHSMTANYSINVVATPEPATMVALGLGVVGIFRKRK